MLNSTDVSDTENNISDSEGKNTHFNDLDISQQLNAS